MCPVTVVSGELWKVGQVRPGDRVKFVRMEWEEARARAAEGKECGLPQPCTSLPVEKSNSGVLCCLPATECTPRVVYRAAGDAAILLEYGPDEVCRSVIHHSLHRWALFKLCVILVFSWTCA